MTQQLIVPVDGSPDSWRAFDVALALAARRGCGVRIVEVATDPVDGRHTDARLTAELEHRGPFEVEVSHDVRLTIDTVADELKTFGALHPAATFVMSSHGRGRSAAVLGSVVESLLRMTSDPIIVVGPKVEPSDFSGPVIATVDGSQESEVALPLAADWAIELGTTPWIINVTTASAPAAGDNDVLDASYAARLAADLRSDSGHAVQFDELQDRHPERAVPAYASLHGASLIVASSHGRSGLSRFTIGSVTAGFVRNATCPVLVLCLPLRPDGPQ